MHARSRIVLQLALAALALGASARSASAQQALAPRTPPADVAAPAKTPGPTVAAARVGVSRATSPELKTAQAPRRAGLGQPVALMVVGGAALLAGLIIDGDAGTVIAVSGALIGLYGLYEYLQ